MRQTWAIFVDAYRELNAKKLFWVTMSISALVVLAFGAVRLTPEGFKVLVWEIPSPFLNLKLGLTNAQFYKMMFQNLGIKFWLTWAATIIGLVATCSMIPDFIGSGSIELSLSRPIGRARFFLTKYLAGLVFAVLQVSAFTLAAFLVIGLRGGRWEPSVLWAVPIVTLMYSYLFCVCALVGLMTRSAIFSLIATLTFWLFIFALHAVETGVFLQLRAAADLNVQRTQQRLERVEQGKSADPPKTAAPASKGLASVIGNLLGGRAAPPPATAEELRAKLKEFKADQAKWTRWHDILFTMKTVLPKTSETTDLLDRWIFSDDELNEYRQNQVERLQKAQGQMQELQGRPKGDSFEMGDAVVALEAERRTKDRSVSWVIGTSLGFEGVVLAFACWRFVRRDF